MLKKSLTAYVKVDFALVFRERVALAMTLLLPAAMYVFFGLMFGKATYGAASYGYYDEYTASFIGLIMLNVALMNVGPVLVIYKEMGFFRRLLATPLDMSSVWISAISRALLIFMLGQVEMMLLGWLMFDRLPSTSLVQLLSAIFVCAFSLFSFGFMLGSLFKSANSAFSAGIFIFQPMLLLSGVSFPLENFPPFMRVFAQVVPMTHVVAVLRAAWRGQFFTTDSLGRSAFLILFGGACALISRKTFRWSSM